MPSATWASKPVRSAVVGGGAGGSWIPDASGARVGAAPVVPWERLDPSAILSLPAPLDARARTARTPYAVPPDPAPSRPRPAEVVGRRHGRHPRRRRPRHLVRLSSTLGLPSWQTLGYKVVSDQQVRVDFEVYRPGGKAPTVHGRGAGPGLRAGRHEHGAGAGERRRDHDPVGDPAHDVRAVTGQVKTCS